MTIGRQPLSLGSGYAWNPFDIFNRKELMESTYEQPGINDLCMGIPLAGRSNLDAIISPDSKWGMSTKMIQIKTGFGSFDISMNGAYQYHLVPNAETDYTNDQVYFAGEFWEVWYVGRNPLVFGC